MKIDDVVIALGTTNAIHKSLHAEHSYHASGGGIFTQPRSEAA